MDSSRADQQVLDGFRPWQIQRLRTRLSHYRASKRHGWERIATDILLDEKLPTSYVDTEDVRRFSESLRRFDSGSQTPSAERLNAVKTFLIGQGLLRPEEMEEKGDANAAPLAFTEFAARGVPGYKAIQAQFTRDLPGTYFWTEREEGRFSVKELVLSQDGTILTVSLSDTIYADPKGQLTAAQNRNRRSRAAISEFNWSGWAAIFSERQVVFMLRDAHYNSPGTCYLLYAIEKHEGDGKEARKLLLLPYSGKQTFTNFDAIAFPSQHRSSISVTDLFKTAIPRGFTIYSRENADGR
ncbi:MAG: hypothetical protein AB1781_07475 [Pseudomonadota bacterium]